ncbi:MAG: polymer-forming cytoskeletal protein [Candidatus Peribacteraceae bacterium]|nr:polymer-forming cytoskeletal protein [Candidatus Peribacteraceae bacterium]
MKRTIPFAVLLLCASIAAPVSGAMIKGGEILSIDQSIDDDLYVAGGQLDILKDVGGDLIAAGGEITIRGNVEEDLTVAGGRVYLQGKVGDDLRAAGGEVRISGTVTDDVFVAGGRVEITEGSIINGDLRIAGGDVYINGTVRGDIDVRGGRVILRGVVSGNLDASADFIAIHARISGTSKLVAEELGIGSTAHFLDDVEYWQQEGQLDFAPYLEGAGASYNPKLARSTVVQREEAVRKFLSMAFLTHLVFSVLFAAFFIAVIAFFTKSTFTDAAKRLKKHPGKSMLTGFLYFVATPIAILLLLLSIIGIPISLFSGVLYGFSIYFSKPITAMVAARYVEIKKGKKNGMWRFIALSILFYLLLKLISYIPILGWIIVILCVFAAYGSVILMKWEKFHRAH